MGFKPIIPLRRQLIYFLVFAGMIFLAACSQNMVSKYFFPGGAVQGAARTPPAKQTRVASSTPTRTPEPTRIQPTATSMVEPTPAVTTLPPASFETNTLYRGVLPVSYIDDACQYYHDRWNYKNASPGTVVVPVMYHGISDKEWRIADDITVSTTYFKSSLEKARKLGFETITMQQMVDFLHHNAYIPPRSLLLIIDDRRLGTVREHFLPILRDYDWKLTMAYITGVINEQEWKQVEDMLATGRTEVQAHGWFHNGETYISEWVSEEIIRQEIFAPIDSIEEHLGYKPIAFIWPGGNYNQLSVDLADEAGYDVGFTVFARGPIMYNWIPLGEADRKVNNPLLVLPRYWSTTLYKNLDFAVELSESAQAQAEKQKFAEIEWYRANCPDYPPLSFILESKESEGENGW